VIARLAGAYRHRLFWPAATLTALLLGNLIFTRHFFRIQVRGGHLYGSVIDILRLSAPLILVGLGMTLVIATKGIDLSVGAVVAIGGAVACLWISKQSDENGVGGVLVACGLTLVAGLICGLWNGLLVARIGIQPIIATLILMVGGRGIAQLITDGQILTVNSSPFSLIGGGYWLTLPLSIIIALGVTALALVLTRRTALGLLIESVGGNAEASRLAGVHSRRLIMLVYMFGGLCAGIAGLMVASNINGADGNHAGLFIELDAILAVVIGGTSLAGGRFTIGGTVIGALLIQTLTTTIFTTGIPPQTSTLFKAIVVTVVCLIQSPAFRAKTAGLWIRRRRQPPEGEGSAQLAAAPADRTEVPA